MPTHDHNPEGAGTGLIGRIRQRLSRGRRPEDCAHPHAHYAGTGGGHATVLVCAECGRALDARDATLRRTQRLGDAKVCVDCGGTYWTLGTRRSV